MRPSIALATLLLAVLATYANAIDVPFFWDDGALVVQNRVVHEGATFGEYFAKPFWPDPEEARAFFRPFVAISYRIDFLLHGENAAGFHVTNVAFHVLNVGLLFALLRRWGNAVYVSALAAGVFGLLPRLTEAVTWISGRTDVLAATGVLAALLLWPISPDERSPWRTSLSALAMSIGLLCKEVALAGAAAIVAFELAREPKRGSEREKAVALAPLAVVVVGYLVLHEHVLGGATGDGLSGISARLSAAGATWGTYAWMLIAPWRPSLQIGRLDAPAAGAVAIGAVVVAASTFAVVKSVERNAFVAAGATMAFASIALVSHVVPIPTSVLCADRFLYFPMIGLALAAGSAGPALAIRWRRALGALAATWIAANTFFTFDRNARMADELGLWMETVERTERENVLPATELGNVLFRAGEWKEALMLQTLAMRALDEQGKAGGLAWAHAISTAASCLSSLGHYAEARALRERSMQRRSTSTGWLDLSKVALHQLDFDASRAAIEHATRASADARREAAELLALISELETTRPARDGSDTASLVQLARFESRAGRRVEAERAWVDVLARPDVDASIVVEGAAFLAARGSLPAATQASERATRDPRLSDEAAGIARVVDARRQHALRVDAIRPRIHAFARGRD